MPIVHNMNIFQQGAKRTTSHTRSRKSASKEYTERALGANSMVGPKASETDIEMSSPAPRDPISGREDPGKQDPLDKLRPQATGQPVNPCTKCSGASNDLDSTRQLLSDKERLLQAAEASNTMLCNVGFFRFVYDSIGDVVLINQTISELQQQLQEAQIHRDFFDAVRSGVENHLTCGICWDEFDNENPPLTVYVLAAILPLTSTNLIITTASHAVIRCALDVHLGGTTRGEGLVSNVVLI
ncbi:hypothetical protein AAF712_008519 [Marasmius tenuissimus]|uniref:Uncharacterized protein n=1 Tax=Marasmius tenuissimus TaxID=585030 RepID=A0ABR2ZU20_9AGAR